MQIKNTKSTYGAVSKFLHWTGGLLIIGLLGLGLYMESLDPAPGKYELYGIHKSLGIIVLALALTRVIWRRLNVTPSLPSKMAKGKKLGAHGTHFLLYILMLAMPLSGWLMSSAGGHTVTIFGWVTLPPLVDKNPNLGGIAHSAHGIIGWALIGLIALHFLAALYHHFVEKDSVLRRMLPFSKV